MRCRSMRAWAEWALTVAAGAAIALALFSRFWFFSCAWTSHQRTVLHHFSVGEGLVKIFEFRPQPPSIHDAGYEFRAGRLSGWYWGCSAQIPPQGPWRWSGGVLAYQDPVISAAGLSLVYPALVLSIPSALLWYIRVRQVDPSRCTRCGYDRRGLAADTKCPECGTPTAPAPK